MSNKSNVTSIRVDSEIYDEFKSAVDSEGKQITSVFNELMKTYLQGEEPNSGAKIIKTPDHLLLSIPIENIEQFSMNGMDSITSKEIHISLRQAIVKPGEVK